MRKDILAARPVPGAGPAAGPAAGSGDAGTPAITIAGVVKSYGATPVLRSVSLDVPAGAITAVLGASGSGKTTLLRLIAGFDHADAGTIRIGGRLVDDGRRAAGPQHRGVGYVPQDAALFPHLTVAANIAFGVPRRDRGRLAELTALVGLEGFGKRYPHQLSGGQQQRVALARALAINPEVVLLDEPFGSLDAVLRESVRADVARILAAAGTTTILVTHDQDEALSLASNIALLDHGEITACGSPRDLYSRPATVAAAAAIGMSNLLDGELDGGLVNCALGTLATAPAGGAPATEPARCRVLVRPEQLLLHAAPQPGGTPATVSRVRYHGHDSLVDLDTDADLVPLMALVGGDPEVEPGQRVWITVNAPVRTWA
jgi:iron(III) transport system ATP-binding protein